VLFGFSQEILTKKLALGQETLIKTLLQQKNPILQGIDMRKSIVLLLVLAFLAASCINAPLSVQAGYKTIVVPDDYSTIASAVGNATYGDTVLVRKGTYLEHSFSIDKTLSLIGENVDNTVIRNIDPATPLFGSSIMVGPTAITVSADNVVISGFTITNASPDIGGGGLKTIIIGNNLPDGIILSGGSYETIAQNSLGYIHSESPYTFIANNTIQGSGALIHVEAAGNIPGHDNVIYKNSLIGTNTATPANGPNTGVATHSSQGNLIASNNIKNCYVGVNLKSAYETVVANIITAGTIGLAVTQWGGANSFFANNIEMNTYATAISGLGNTVYDNNFINNYQQIGSPDLIISPNPTTNASWFKDTQGNYWGDYLSRYPNASEVDSSGIGDTPYVIDASNIDQYPLMVPYNTSNLTIQLPTWADLSLLTWLPTVLFPPQISPTSPPATPTPSPTASPTPTPGESPTPSPEATPPNKEPETTLTNSVAVASGALVTAVGIGLYLYFKKRRPPNSPAS
jgi:nitrous oxidase accessory protein NosD